MTTRIALMLFVVFGCLQAWSQGDDSARMNGGPEDSTRNHFVLKVGSLYEQGDFGTPDTTRVLFIPTTFRYNGERFDISATPSFGVIRTSGGVVLIDGTPTPTNNAPASQTSGMGDTLIKTRLFVTEDGGSESAVPAISPFFKVKIPTGDPARNLSTGSYDYGFGVELDKQIRSLLLFGDVGYTFIGKVPGLDLRNRPAASFGIGTKASKNVTVSGLLDWRRAIVAQTPDPLELVGLVNYKATANTTVSPNMFVGLTNGSSTFGVGVEFAFKFGRY